MFTYFLMAKSGFYDLEQSLKLMNPWLGYGFLEGTKFPTHTHTLAKPTALPRGFKTHDVESRLER
jgi:hypothetical protein